MSHLGIIQVDLTLSKPTVLYRMYQIQASYMNDRLAQIERGKTDDKAEV